jgi:pentatricopeptide repeat protein
MRRCNGWNVKTVWLERERKLLVSFVSSFEPSLTHLLSAFFSDEERIHVRNALIGAHFANKDPASALAIVESLIPSNPNPSSSLSLSEPFVQSSTFTSVIKGFLSLDDVPSALSWFHRIVASDSPLPPLEPEAFVALLSVASQKRDVALYDEVFDRFTANPPIGYHFRPVELAEAIHLHIEAAEAPSVSSEARNRHIDRIFEFVRRCDEHERSRYLYPAVIAGPLLRLLILESRLDDVADVYGRALRAAQENVEDPLSVISFHSHFVESTIHWVTSESATPLRLNIQDRLHLVSTIYGNAQIASLPTDLTIRDLAPRVFHLYQQAKLEVAGDTSALDLRNETVSLLLEAAVMVDLRNQPASTAVACATILDDLIGIQRRSGQTFDVDLMTAAQTVVACRGEEYASNLLAPLGPAFLQACGVYVLASQAESFPAPPASIADSTVSLNPDAPAFEPSPASSGPSIALTSSELANSATSVTSGPPSLIDDDSTALAKPKPNALAFYSELHESLQIDKSLSDIVDLAFTFSPKQTQAKMTALDSYNLLKDGLTNGYVARVEVLARLISGLGRMSEKDKMIEVFELAHAVNFYTEGQEKRWFDIESAVIIGFANCGDMERANFHRQNILQAGGAPTADAYGALVTGTKDSTDVAAIARQLYTEARSHGVKMNLFFYNTLISIFARARKAEEALTLFYAAMDEGITLRTVTYAAAVVRFSTLIYIVLSDNDC